MQRTRGRTSRREPEHNASRGRATGTATQRRLENGRLGAPSGVPRVGRGPRGRGRGVERFCALGPGRRGGHLGCRSRRHVDRGYPCPARTTRASSRVVVDAVHAPPRHSPRPGVRAGIGRVVGVDVGVAVSWATAGVLSPLTACVPLAARVRSGATRGRPAAGASTAGSGRPAALRSLRAMPPVSPAPVPATTGTWR